MSRVQMNESTCRSMISLCRYSSLASRETPSTPAHSSGSTPAGNRPTPLIADLIVRRTAQLDKLRLKRLRARPIYLVGPRAAAYNRAPCRARAFERETSDAEL